MYKLQLYTEKFFSLTKTLLTSTTVRTTVYITTSCYYYFSAFTYMNTTKIQNKNTDKNLSDKKPQGHESFVWQSVNLSEYCGGVFRLRVHFTVVCLVTWPLSRSEAGVDLALIQTLLLFICKQHENNMIYMLKAGRSLSKQGQHQPHFDSKARSLSTQL